jgi:hypothetical protein
MSSVLGHIVQKRYSQHGEDIATDALAYILGASEAARAGFLRLLRGIAPELPDLYFRTQRAEGNARPDMWGYDLGTPRVLVENKFWAGLTDSQPLAYLRLLADYPQPTVLLVVVPAARGEAVWRELCRRVDGGGIGVSPCSGPAGILHLARISHGPYLALASWAAVLANIERELYDDPAAANDVAQLRGLCDEADQHAFAPFVSADLSDQRIPRLMAQLSKVVEEVVQSAVTEGILTIDGLRPTHSWTQSGRYVAFPQASGVGAFLGVHLGLWRERGATPLWLVFSSTDWGRAPVVRTAIEPWAARANVVSAMVSDEFVVGIPLANGEEKDQVVRSAVAFLQSVARELSTLGG